MSSDGSFVIVYNSEAYDLPGAGVTDVFARVYDASGQPLGDEFKVNSSGWYRHQDASVAMNSKGEFVVVWENWVVNGPIYVTARAYKANGSPLTAETIIAIGGGGRVLARPDGNFILSWGDTVGAFTQVYDPMLRPIGSRIPGLYAMALRGDGGFVRTWAGSTAEGYAIFAREFGPDGAPDGHVFQVSRADSVWRVDPAVASSYGGDYVITWTRDRYPDEQFTAAIEGRRYVTAPTVRSSSFEFDSTPQRLIFTFSENVGASLSASDLELVNLTTGQTIDPATLTLNWDVATFTASFSFPVLPGGVLPDGRYRARPPAASVADPGQNLMTSDASLSFFFLGGDANHDARADRDDLSILTANWQQFPRTFSQGDFNYDARVDARDLLILARHWDQSLWLPPLKQLAFSTAMPGSRVGPALRPIDQVETLYE